MHSAGRHLLRCGLSSELGLYGQTIGVRALGTAAPEAAKTPKKEKKLNKKATHSQSFVQNMVKILLNFIMTYTTKIFVEDLNDRPNIENSTLRSVECLFQHSKFYI